MAISVVIADDHSVVRRGLRALLEGERDIAILAEAADGRAALDAVERCRPDILVLDLTMPKLRGADVLREIAARELPTRVVVLTVHASESDVADALRHGAVGYVVKEANASDLIRAIREAASGRRFVSAPVSQARVEETLVRNATGPSDPYDALTVREREVLLLTAQGHTSQEVADQLGISRRTAETHRANLMRKLALRNQKDLIHYALRRGILEL